MHGADDDHPSRWIMHMDEVPLITMRDHAGPIAPKGFAGCYNDV